MQLRIRSITYLAEDINGYELVDPNGRDLPRFSAGAHIGVRLGEQVWRDYSLWNDPAERRRYSIAVLREKLRRPPSDGFRLVILLPAKANSGADDTRGMLGSLVEADNNGGRLLACTLVSPDGGQGKPVYVHAKIGIVDDLWLTIGSANLNEHSLFNDSEVNIVTRDESLARDTRQRLWAEHLEVGREAVSGDPTEVVDSLWKPIGKEQLERAQRGEGPTRRLTMLPGISKRSGLLLGPLQGLLVDA